MTDKVSANVAAAYDQQYADGVSEWRELGGKYKVDNILEVCRGRDFHRVLDCGAGEGSLLKFLDVAGVFRELYAIEISGSGVAQIQSRNLPRLREARVFDGYTIPYPDQFFDLAYCSHVVEHVEHPRLLLRELRRVSAFQVFEVPLDYSIGVDRRVRGYLAYGHVNIYTPSLFRFLLKSEGFEILAEKHSRTAIELLRYNWYHNRRHKPSLVRELVLFLEPWRQVLRRVWHGQRWYREYGFSAYTCLARGVGELKILGET